MPLKRLSDDLPGSQPSLPESPRKSPPRRQRRGLDTRERIIEAATEEFALHGLAGSSMRAVAKRAGVAHTRFVYYFESKEGLWRAVIEQVGGRLRSRYSPRLDQADDHNNTEILRAVLSDFVRFSAENPQFHWIISHEARRGGSELTWIHSTHQRPFFDRLAAMIRKSQKTGEFVEGDPHHLHYLFIGAATRIFMVEGEAERTLNTSIHSAEFIEQHTQACLSLFFRDKPAAS